jgi:predicted permease
LYRFLPALLYTLIVRKLSHSQLGSIVIFFIFCSFGLVAFKLKQVRKFNPKVTLRRVHAIAVTVEKQQVLFILNVFVNLFIQQAIHMHRVVIRGLP